MAYETEFHNWQNDTGWDKGRYENDSPNLSALLTYLLERWGGVSLGIEGNRKIRKGGSPSSHAFGAALDWRWGAHDSFPNMTAVDKDVVLHQVIPFLLDWSEVLHVQAIHDQGRIWRSDRPGTDWDGKWKDYSTGYGAWLHIETTKAGWDDATPIQERIDAVVAALEGNSTPAPPPPPPPSPSKYGTWPVTAKAKLGPTQARNTQNPDAIRYLQTVLRDEASQNITVDGWFGTETERCVRNLQKFFGASVDGWVGPETWGVVDFLASR